MTKQVGVSAALLAAALVGACGGGSSMTGSGTNGSGGSTSAGAAFMSVSPAGGATGMAVGSPITLRFSGAMGAGMEQYVDLHRGDLSGPEVAMSCAWSAERTQLTCTPGSPLASRTMHAIHVGGGMMGSGWRNANGSYGMEFTFTTA
jgi:hypothetical protein